MMENNNRCYICYELLSDNQFYHTKCLKLLFNTEILPELSFNNQDMESMALELVKQKMGVPGVQKKLSLSLIKEREGPHLVSHLTIVGYLGGEYILKPPTIEYPQMPEIEDLTMHLAHIANIKVARHGLIVLPDNTLAYITKRFDRQSSKKIAVEDLCQLSYKVTEDKYKSSSEKAGKIIYHFASMPGEEVLKFFELIIFCFIVGNADMHLKNFTLITQDLTNIRLAPCYDLLSTRLLIPESVDPEELALTVNGKKRNIRKKDFFELGRNLNIPEKVVQHTINSMFQSIPNWHYKIQRSFISNDLKLQYLDLIKQRCNKLS